MPGHYIVTGGSSGLGFASAEKLLAAGHEVTIFDKQEPLNPTKASFAMVDITNADQVVGAVADANNRAPLTGLVNSAGAVMPEPAVVKGDDGKFVAHDLGKFKTMIDLNLVGAFSVATNVAAAICNNGKEENGEKGCIVFIGSIPGIDGMPGWCGHVAAKGGLHQMTHTMARDLARTSKIASKNVKSAHGIRVMTIAPGMFDTPATQGFPPAKKEFILGKINMPKRMGHADELADAVMFCINNKMMNGDVMRVDAATRLNA